MPLAEPKKLRGITKTTPAEVGQFLIENADRIKACVVLADYDDPELREEGDDEVPTLTHERYSSGCSRTRLAFWIACLQATPMRRMLE